MATKLSRADWQDAERLRQMPLDQLDQIAYQNYGVSAYGLQQILRTAHNLSTGGELSHADVQKFAHNVFGNSVPAERIAQLHAAIDSAGNGASRGRAFLQNLMQDRPDMKHRLAEVYQMSGIFSEREIAGDVEQHFNEKTARENEQDKALGRFTPDQHNTTADPTKIGSNAHALSVRSDIEAALDETSALKGFRNASDRMAPVADALAGSTAGDIFRDRASEESGESNTIRSDLGNDLSAVYDSSVSSEYAKNEGL
jgi:hypothetical protein